MPSSSGAKVPVLVEMRVQPGTPANFALSAAAQLPATSFEVDPAYHPVPMRSAAPTSGLAAADLPQETYIVRGAIAEEDIPSLEQHPDVVRVWRDTQIAPFPRQQAAAAASTNFVRVQPTPAAAPCPIGVCDCDPGTAKGTMADVAAYLVQDQAACWVMAR